MTTLRTPKGDKKEALAVIKEDALALKYMGEFKKNKEVVLEAVRKNGRSLKYAARKLKKDKDIVLAAVKQDPASFQHAAKTLQKDSQFIFQLTAINPLVLSYIAA